MKRFFGKSKSDGKIKVPTLIIYGAKDTAILPETVEGIGEFVDAPFEEFTFPNSGHWVQQEDAETVTQSLHDFLAE